MTLELTKKDIRRVARRVVETLEQGGYTCCLYGSAACSVYGMERVPADIDVVVFTQDDVEDIKAYLARENSRCYLEDSKNLHNTYKKVFYALSWTPRLRCKVDIIIGGQNSPLKIPKIPVRHIQHVNDFNIPVLPFLVLLILKVQGWHDHRSSQRTDFLRKVPQDKRDIDELLGMVDDKDHLDQFSWLPSWFIDHAQSLVVLYTDRYPNATASFNDMGFDVY
ncbi:hypothetical protein F5887DRAFT_895365 [Amanita rubescens]|nr:hypothetical protein F5887DRAFT_895365 [Amanita rubescens]